MRSNLPPRNKPCYSWRACRFEDIVSLSQYLPHDEALTTNRATWTARQLGHGAKIWTARWPKLP